MVDRKCKKRCRKTGDFKHVGKGTFVEGGRFIIGENSNTHEYNLMLLFFFILTLNGRWGKGEARKRKSERKRDRNTEIL